MKGFSRGGERGSTNLLPPVPNLLQPPPPRMLKQPYPVPAMFKLVDVGPDLGLPAVVVRSGFPAGGAAGMQRDLHRFDRRRNRPRQFDEDAAHLVDLLVFAQHVLVTQQIAKGPV